MRSLNRRRFLESLLGSAAAIPLSRAAQAANATAPRTLKITDLRVLVTNPTQETNGNFVLVKIVTNQAGLYGWGDATCTGSEQAVAKMIEEHLRPGLVGRNPMDIEALWQTMYLLPYYRSGSVHMSALSGLDMALWDIKGKVAGLPVYELLGGKVRDKLLTYGSANGRSFGDVEDAARKLIARGYKVIRVQMATPGVEGGYGPPPSAQQKAVAEKAHADGLSPVELWDPAAYARTVPRLLDHLRKKLGDEIEILHDVHERVTPNQAVSLAKALEPYRLFFLEDPLRPEHLDAFQLIRRQSGIPLAMGELYTGAWEGMKLVEDHLVDYVRHDLCHCGGITTGKKVAIACESRGILSAWHGPPNISPVAHLANGHVDLSIPNFGVQEFVPPTDERMSRVFSAWPKYADGHLTLADAPGLGVEINEAAADKLPYLPRPRPSIRRADGTPWPY